MDETFLPESFKDNHKKSGFTMPRKSRLTDTKLEQYKHREPIYKSIDSFTKEECIMNKDIIKRVITVSITLAVVMGIHSLVYYLTQNWVIDKVLIQSILVSSIFGLVPIGLKWYRLGYIYLSFFTISMCVDFYLSSAVEGYNGMAGGFRVLFISILGFVIGIIVEVVYKSIVNRRKRV